MSLLATASTWNNDSKKRISTIRKKNKKEHDDNDEIEHLAHITNKNELLKQIAEIIDKRIYTNYHLFPTNYIAYDWLNESNTFENQYTKVIKFQEYKNLPKYYRISDIGIWPSQESTSQLDALACGLPLILNDEVGTPERVMDCGFLFRKDSVDDLSEKISILLNKDLRLKFSNNAAMKAKQNYSWKEIACKYIKDYVNLLEQ